MESNVRRTLLIIFAALVILLLPWSLIPVARIWSGVAEDTKKADQDEGFYNILRRLDAEKRDVYMAKSVQTPSPTESAKTFRDDAESRRQAVIEAIVNNDKAFEGPFLMADNVPASDEKLFKEVYRQCVPGDNGLAQMPAKQGLYTVTGANAPAATDLASDTPTMPEDYPRRALQKKVWIYQRVIYSLLKNASDGTRLVATLEPPSGAGAAKYAIVIENCEAKNEQDKGTFATASKEPLFYGDKIPEITVSFTVEMDERHIPELLEELAVYNPDNAPIVDANPNKTPIAGLREVKPMTFIVQKMAIRRSGPPKNPYAPLEPGKNVIEAPSIDAAQADLGALRPWVKVEFTIKALDYNPDSGKQPSK
jgi:hypothetical protein